MIGTDNSELLAIAVEAAREAGAILLEGGGRAVASWSKEGKHNLVTEYDRRSEDFLKTRLTSAVPGTGFFGEETGGDALSAPVVWVVDPLDGTVNFAHGIPLYCVSIAAVRSGVPVAGVIHAPALGETWTAALGMGCFLESTKMSVSATSSLNDAMLVTGFPYDVADNPHHCIDQFSSIIRRGLPVRRLGSAALDLAWLAAGRFDAFWEVRLQPWDMAAGVLMVREAGGTVTHYDGRSFVLGTDSIIATNGQIHDELIQALQEATP
jgi:myo-inositol-1(or 4)-monophosphatase